MRIERAHDLPTCPSRVLRAMAGDKGVPLSKVFRVLNEYTLTPVNAVWAMAALAFLLGLPLLYSTSVFSAIASISSVGLYLSCECAAIPQVPSWQWPVFGKPCDLMLGQQQPMADCTVGDSACCLQTGCPFSCASSKAASSAMGPSHSAAGTSPSV